ncbi:MAG: LytTR family DNA-binding domain-containing protein [Bacteroidota bacterium]
MKLLLIEDEELALEKLRSYLEEILPGCEIIASLDSVKSVLAYLSFEKEIDLIFADIELIDGHVFSAFGQVNVPCPVIFLTAFDQYAMQAFEANGIAYLLKPFSFDQLKNSIDRVLKLGAKQTQADKQFLGDLYQAMLAQQAVYKQRFVVRKGKSILLLPTEEILLIRSQAGLITAINKKGRKCLLQESSLSEIEKQLDPSCFLRINRSEILHIQAIEHLEYYTKDSLAVILVQGLGTLISSQSRTPTLRKWLAK